MNIQYQFATGEVVEITVGDALGEVIVEIEREAYNSNQRETRRHRSLEGLQERGFHVAAPCDVSAEVEVASTREQLQNALAGLLPQQQALIQRVYFEETSLAQIAREEGVGESAIRDRLQRIYKKIKKFLK